MAELKLYNTLTRTKEPFAPLDPANVRMYVCGPTVYDFAHIGNARPVIVFDVLFRLLRHLYPGPGKASDGSRVTYARNITDVDDKINDRAVRDYPGLPLNEAIRKVTESTNAQFQADVAALGCLPPTYQPRATEHMQDMIDIVGRLIANGYAYIALGPEGREVLFSVDKMPTYGRLSNRKLDENIAGARVAVEEHKKNPADFVLWKESSADQPGWNAEFEPDAEFVEKYRNNSDRITIYGRPGWHIECSAMSMAKLLAPFGGGLTCDDPVKNTFDIHGGGIDLVFPHHENEIAQSCCAFGSERMASVWMHNGFLQVEGQKMSKSLGNFTTIADVLKDWPGEVARLTMLKTHYRQPIDWTVKSLEESRNILEGWHYTLGQYPIARDGWAPPAELVKSLCDDLNVSGAIAALHNFAKGAKAGDIASVNKLAAGLVFLGVYQPSRDLAVETTMLREVVDDAFRAKINALITARLTARNAKNFAESDRIRDELVAMGIQIMDAKDPITGELKTTWEVKR
ncbi:MAG: cysteinyl-tRNA [Beijerinckiaceae bacterium]|nr:MAG: cysteinyl-tRNA [Beijerinckiaceae bacterium]